jgi:ubiquinone biosynthesis accessory factor UbiJ
MTNTPPFSFLESIASRFQPPAWVVDEGQQRMVLFLNHVLMQEKSAQDRLVRQKGRIVDVKWGLFAIDLIVTPAGLVDRAPPGAEPDLLLSLALESPLTVIQAVLAGKPPPLKIEGDVQLAADLGWLADNLRWDAEEDLSRLIGDAPAHAVASVGRRVVNGLKQFLARTPLATGSGSLAEGVSPSSERNSEPPQGGSAPLATSVGVIATSKAAE